MKITIKINTAADKIADCIARAKSIIDALDTNTARMPSEPQLPPGLPPLPPVPEGYDRWEYRGTRWRTENPVMHAYLGVVINHLWETYIKTAIGAPGHYIEPVKEGEQ